MFNQKKKKKIPRLISFNDGIGFTVGVLESKSYKFPQWFCKKKKTTTKKYYSVYRTRRRSEILYSLN